MCTPPLSLFGIFHLICSDHGWPLVTETMGRETTDKGGGGMIEASSPSWLAPLENRAGRDVRTALRRRCSAGLSLVLSLSLFHFKSPGPPISFCAARSSVTLRPVKASHLGLPAASWSCHSGRQTRSSAWLPAARGITGLPLWFSLSPGSMPMLPDVHVSKTVVSHLSQLFVLSERINSFAVTPSGPEGKSMNELRSLRQEPIHLQVFLWSN